MQPKLRCAVYTRVSTDNQAEKEFNSCEAQEEKIRSFINSQENMEIFRVYVDPGYSGGNLERPGITEMLRDIQGKNIDLVIAYKIDRLTRSPRDFYKLIELFERHEVDFISVTERFDTSTPSGRLLRNIMLTFAQFERELTSERTRDKMQQRAQKGMWNGGLVPFGYRNENKKLVIEKKDSETVKKIFDNFVGSKSLAKTYEYLKAAGFRTRQGNIFAKTSLANILRNVIYCGKVKQRGEVYQGIHEPIISEDLFNLAQEQYREYEGKPKTIHPCLFPGMVICGDCGMTMTPCYTSKKKGKKFYYYRCTSTFKRDWDACEIKQVSARKLEEYVMENLRRIAGDKNYLENLFFRLNASSHVKVRNTSTKSDVLGGRKGLELSEICTDLRAETFQKTLCQMIEEYQQAEATDGKKSYLERSLVLKNYLKDIYYSKEEIQLEVRYDGVSGRGTTPERAAGCPRTAGGERRDAVMLGAGYFGRKSAADGAERLVRKVRNGSPDRARTCNTLVTSTPEITSGLGLSHLPPCRVRESGALGLIG